MDGWRSGRPRRHKKGVVKDGAVGHMTWSRFPGHARVVRVAVGTNPSSAVAACARRVWRGDRETGVAMARSDVRVYIKRMRASHGGHTPQPRRTPSPSMSSSSSRAVNSPRRGTQSPLLDTWKAYTHARTLLALSEKATNSATAPQVASTSAGETAFCEQ